MEGPRAFYSKNGKTICRIIPDKDAEMNFGRLRPANREQRAGKEFVAMRFPHPNVAR